MTTNDQNSSNEWSTCCRGRKCPEVRVWKNVVEIKDDHGGLVNLTFREYDLIAETVAAMRDDVKE
jgi:hypothetical protein